MFFGFQMTNVGMPIYVAQLGAGAHVVGLITTITTVAAIVVRIFSGPALDRFGRAGMLIGGLVVMACSIFAYAVFPVVGIILGLRLLHGFGWGFGSTAASTIAADIIPKRRFAEGMGYFAMTNAISSALAPAAAVALVQGPGAVYMIGVSVGVTVLALVLAVIQSALSRGSHGSDASDASGDAAEAAEGARSAAGPAGDRGKPAVPARGFDAFFERRSLVPSLLIMLVNVGFGCITTFIALHGMGQGVDNVSIYFIVYAIVTLVSRPGIGKLIDRYGYRIPAILSALCTSGTLALIAVSASMFMFAVAGVLAGLGVGTAMGTFQAMAVADVEPWRRGVATSTYFTAFDLGIAVGALVGGVIANAFGYVVMYLVIALFPLAACIASFALVKKAR